MSQAEDTRPRPFYEDEWLSIFEGDCRTVLAGFPSDSVDCVVTSPPYWGLRDYGTEGQLGLERTPEEYVANMVAVFREVRRVLKASGTCWLNLGDSYSGGTTDRADQDINRRNQNGPEATRASRKLMDNPKGKQRPVPPGLKPKDLVGIPWRVAFALQADGWFLRSDIIWSKPNPMPESVTDRPTKSHEYLFLLTKSARYYFDADAVREPHIAAHLGRYSYDFWPEGTKEASGNGRPGGASNTGGSKQPNPAGRNIRSVWTIATRPYPGAHFAVFPPELPERCIKAGSSERGVCPECGAPWVRAIERGRVVSTGGGPGRASSGSVIQDRGDYNSGKFIEREHITVGWLPGCPHYQGEASWTPVVDVLAHGSSAAGVTEASTDPASAALATATSSPVSLGSLPAVVLDPFAGSGTVGLVANRLSRRAILIDLNPEYLKQQMARNAQTPLGLGAA